MKEHVTVIPEDNLVIVDQVPLWFQFAAPLNLHALQWHAGSGHMEWTDDLNHPLTPSDYEADVAPFVTAWEAEKARMDENANHPPTLDEAKSGKLAELAKAFIAAEASGWLASSLGFDIDATERANRDIAGLITVMSQPGAPETTYFCDHHNQMRPVTLANLHTMQLEIITYGQNLYAQKWQIRTAIEAAETVDAVQAVVIAFGGDPIAPDTSDTDPAPEATA